jgi:hypothetical protein
VQTASTVTIPTVQTITGYGDVGGASRGGSSTDKIIQAVLRLECVWTAAGNLETHAWNWVVYAMVMEDFAQITGGRAMGMRGAFRIVRIVLVSNVS